MTISLQKKQSISLSKEAPSVSKFYIACGWQEQAGIDVDVSAFCCKTGQDGNPYLFAGPDPYSFLCFFNNTNIPGNGVVHSGDNLSGKNRPELRGTTAADDDESIIVDISALPAEVDEIAIVLTINEATAKRLSFGQVKDCFVRIAENDMTGRVLASYKPTEDFSAFTSIQIGSLMRRASGWEFEAVGQGYVADFEQIVGQFVDGATA